LTKRKEEGEAQTEALMDMVRLLPIGIINGISDEVFREAGRIKSCYKISLADSIVLGEASANNLKIITSDHHEFNIIESNENINFCWIR
jgi:predicted nucleic acid-binding protein